MSSLNIYVPFIGIFYELEALERYIDLLEEQWPRVVKQQQEAAQKEQREYDYSDGDWHRIQQELNELKEDILPRFFIGPILVTLWAIFESTVGTVAKHIAERQKQKIMMNDLRGDLPSRMKKYFNHVLKFPLLLSDEKWGHLDRFKVLRNVIAHANGQLENIKSPKDIKKIEKWNKDGNIGVSIIDGNLIMSLNFVRNTYSEVSEILKSMTKNVEKNYLA